MYKKAHLEFFKLFFFLSKHLGYVHTILSLMYNYIHIYISGRAYVLLTSIKSSDSFSSEQLKSISILAFFDAVSIFKHL